jgi:hypothetical protein
MQFVKTFLACKTLLFYTMVIYHPKCLIMSEIKLHTPEQVAKMLGISPNTLKYWRVTGVKKGPPFIRLNGNVGAVRYPDDMLRRWVANHD